MLRCPLNNFDVHNVLCRDTMLVDLPLTFATVNIIKLFYKFDVCVFFMANACTRCGRGGPTATTRFAGCGVSEIDTLPTATIQKFITVIKSCEMNNFINITHVLLLRIERGHCGTD